MLPDSEDVAKINTDLSTLRDQGAEWWSYLVSHSTFNIVVGDPLGNKSNLVLCLIGCDRIAGPTVWENQRIEVILSLKESHASDGCYISKNQSYYILRDESVGFHAEGIYLLSSQNCDIHKRGSLWVRRAPHLRN